jgi:hypothetical protein
MTKREHLPIYQTRSTRVLNLDDLHRRRPRRLALAAAGLVALIALAALIGQGLRVGAEPGGAPAAGSRPDSAREQVLSELAEAARTVPAAPTNPPATATPGQLTVSGTGGEGLRLRAAPGLAAAQVAVLPEGSAVRPTGRQAAADGLAWAEVADADGASGWAAAEYLR